MTLWLDADATPRDVKDLVFRAADRLRLDTVLVAGHPGSTDRQLTVAELETLRNEVLPKTLLRSSELRGRYLQFAKTSQRPNVPTS